MLKNVATPQAEGFEMRNCGFQGGGEGIYLRRAKPPPQNPRFIAQSQRPTPNRAFYGNAREFWASILRAS
ncbi:hypothetical protein [Helicobacter canis]|uniref:hypothetical protein n=1 Tax=Helicobacter canis TaxID=29419 RepID=UPI000E0F4169|nr:hypothetical protein [Helicobacter canis]